MSNTVRKNVRNNKKAPNNNQEDEPHNSSNISGAPQALNEPVDYSAPPHHLYVLTKKIRAVKKKLRKIQETEKALSAGKKLSAEQQRLLEEKLYHERSLKELNEIQASLQDLDLTVQLRQLLGIFVAAANTSSPKLNELAAVLLPPGVPETDFQPLRELQHACVIAQKFLNASDEELFSQPRVTYAELRAEVRTFLDEEALRTPPVPVEVVQQPTTAETSPQQPNGTVTEQQETTSAETPAALEKESAPSTTTSPSTTSPGSTAVDQTQTSPSSGDEKPSSDQDVQQNGTSSPKEESEDEQVQKRKNNRNKSYRGGRRGRGTGRKDGEEKVNNSDNQTNNPSDSNSKQSGRGGRGRGGTWRGGKSFSPKTGENKPAKTTGTKPPAKPAAA